MRRKFSVEDRLWFTSDTHFGHIGILFMRQFFKTIDQMDEVMIENWNKVVGPSDHIFHLGDLSFYRPHRTIEILGCLNGIKYLVRGNHDRNNLNTDCLRMFDGGVEHYHEITVGSLLITLCHFPLRSWNGMHHDSWNLHGHSHGSLNAVGKQLDVGVDTHGFSPYSIEEIAEDMKNKKFVRTDHHGDESKRYIQAAAQAYTESRPADLSE